MFRKKECCASTCNCVQIVAIPVLDQGKYFLVLDFGVQSYSNLRYWNSATEDFDWTNQYLEVVRFFGAYVRRCPANCRMTMLIDNGQELLDRRWSQLDVVCCSCYDSTNLRLCPSYYIWIFPVVHQIDMNCWNEESAQVDYPRSHFYSVRRVLSR